MNIKDTIDEIGIFETNIQIEKYLDDIDLLKCIETEMPIPTKCESKQIIDSKVDELIRLNKQNIFMLSNEISLIEKLSIYKNKISNIIVCLSRNLSEEQINNIKSNTSKNTNVVYINELDFPNIVKPSNSLILVVGYESGNNCIVTLNTYRMLEIYKSFLGKNCFYILY